MRASNKTTQKNSNALTHICFITAKMSFGSQFLETRQHYHESQNYISQRNCCWNSPSQRILSIA